MRRSFGVDALEAEGAHRCCLALEVELDRLVHGHRVADEAVGASPSRISPGWADCSSRAATLTASPVTNDSPADRVAGHDLAGVDARAQPDAHAVVAEHVPLMASSAVLQLAGGADRAQGIVLVDGRHAEDGHDRVADELLDRAAVSLDDLASGGEVARRASGASTPGRAARPWPSSRSRR